MRVNTKPKTPKRKPTDSGLSSPIRPSTPYREAASLRACPARRRDWQPERGIQLRARASPTIAPCRLPRRRTRAWSIPTFTIAIRHRGRKTIRTGEHRSRAVRPDEAKRGGRRGTAPAGPSRGPRARKCKRDRGAGHQGAQPFECRVMNPKRTNQRRRAGLAIARSTIKVRF
jgi:hypothetical protein